MMSSKEHSLRAIIRSYDAEPVELALAVFMLLWGVRLLCPGSTFNSASSFSIMGRIADEEVWGGVMLLVSAMKLLALRSGDHLARAGAAFAGTLIWALIWVSISLANPNGTGVVVYSTFAVLSAWVLWRNILQTYSRTE